MAVFLDVLTSPYRGLKSILKEYYMILTLIRFYKLSQEFYAPEFSQGFYSSDKIKKTQNEHLIIVCQNLIGL